MCRHRAPKGWSICCPAQRWVTRESDSWKFNRPVLIVARRTLSRIAHKLATLPFVFVRRLFRFAVDRHFSTYGGEFGPKSLEPLFRKALAPGGWSLDKNKLRASTEHYLRHRYDLLGSGWTTVGYGVQCRGLHGFVYPPGQEVVTDPGGAWLRGRINPGNLSRSRSIWRLVDRDYVPVDWQLDFKSGFRWSERRWYLHIPFREGRGVDVKVPWELARMQHLVQLAWAFALARENPSGFREADAYAREFRNQVLDFCATNPPRFGVNWRCTMDVAIRVANWVLAYDLFRMHEAVFDTEFKDVLTASVFDHVEYIVDHLEWFEHGRGNHYLANISGLIFAATVLPRSEKTEKWLAFGAGELIKEAEHQFNRDGTGAEASTAYHCLCVEMVTCATAVLLGLPESMKTALQRNLKAAGITESKSQEIFPQWYTERMEKMAEFVMAISRPDGTISQIGDNDSGRFFKLFPQFQEQTVAGAKRMFGHLHDYVEMEEEEQYLMEDCLDRRHVVAALNGFFRRPDFERFSGDLRCEAQVVAALAGGVVLKSCRDTQPVVGAAELRIGDEDARRRFLGEWECMTAARRSLSEVRIERKNEKETWQTYGFPDFGLYIFRSGGVYVSVRCGAMGKNVLGAHAHNDQLSLELTVDEEDVIADPGTCLYMPVPEIRNRYRSVTAHFTPQAADFEPSPLDEHIFYLHYENEGECLYFGPMGFLGRHRGPGFTFYRSVTLGDAEIRVQDWSATHDLVSLDAIRRPEFSPGYGMCVAPDQSRLRR